MAKRAASRRGRDLFKELPSGALALSARGAAVKAVVEKFYRAMKPGELFAESDDKAIGSVAEALRISAWSDQEAAKVANHVLTNMQRGRELDVASLRRWVLAHPDCAQAVIECMDVRPPDDIQVTQVLSHAGSQKLVFLATWRLTRKQVVVKRVIAAADQRGAIMEREGQAHPLSIAHPNIIETHVQMNRSGEKFLVEERLPDVLDDEWPSPGMHEAANLLSDVGNALNYLHSKVGVVHGDIKPDNIGKRGGDYIVLDFGICRPAAQFTKDTTGTGSLRTRAPELLIEDQYDEPAKVDVWALGATVFNTMKGRFPLIEEGEPIPRLSDPDPKSRDRFEAKLKRRIETEWDKWVDLEGIDPPLRDVLARVLEREPANRCSARELVDLCEQHLSVFVRRSDTIGRFSPVEEVAQLRKHLPNPKVLRLMPVAEREKTSLQLIRLKETPGLHSDDLRLVESLLAEVG